jgi:hypothetical protein
MTLTNLPVAAVVPVHAAWADAPLASAPDRVVAIITQAGDAVLHEAVPDSQRIGRRA